MRVIADAIVNAGMLACTVRAKTMSTEFRRMAEDVIESLEKAAARIDEIEKEKANGHAHQSGSA